MSCIVADSGPLIALAGVDLLHLPVELYGQVLVPQIVYEECTCLPSRVATGRIELAVSGGQLKVLPEQALPKSLSDVVLDPGELSALALAIDCGADILIDEERGRRKARELGLPVVGTCGLLLLAKRGGLLERVGPELHKIRCNGYFLSDQLIHQVCVLADE